MTKWVNTRGNHRVYHLRKDCMYLTSGNFREAYTDEIRTHDLDLCSRCAQDTKHDDLTDNE